MDENSSRNEHRPGSRLDDALQPMVEELSSSGALPPFEEVRRRASTHRRRRRVRILVASGAVAACLAVGVAGLAVSAPGDRAPIPAGQSGKGGSPSTSASPTTGAGDGAEPSGGTTTGEAVIADPGSVAIGSEATDAGDVATLWRGAGQGGTLRWVLGMRSAAGTVTAVDLPGTSYAPSVLGYADGFLLTDAETGALVAVGIDGEVTYPETTETPFVPVAGDVAMVAPSSGAVQVFSPALGQVQQLPEPDVDDVRGAVATGSGRVVVTWTRFETTERGAEAGVATWDGTAWDLTVLDTTDISSSGVAPTTTAGYLASAGSQVVATTADDRETASRRTLWTSSDDGTSWNQRDEETLPLTLSSVSVTPDGTVIGNGWDETAGAPVVVRVPPGTGTDGVGRVTDPQLAQNPHGTAPITWSAGDAVWARSEDGATLWRSSDAGATWEPVAPAGR